MKKEVKVNSKRNIDKTKIFTKIMAGFLAVLMVLAVCSTFIAYIVQNITK